MKLSAVSLFAAMALGLPTLSHAQAYSITTVAGNGFSAYFGDTGQASVAAVNFPQGIALDSSGLLYIADTYSSVIRKVAADGTISTIAGNATGGFKGDGAMAIKAELNQPYGVAVDTTGNIFILDLGNNRIRKVDTSGNISTLVGNGTPGYAGDGAASTKAEIGDPLGIAVDGSGNLYIADTFNNVIRKVDGSGNISTFAGNHKQGYSGDGGAATSAMLSHPWGVTADASGSIYISDTGNDVIRKVAANGVITTVAGTGVSGYSGDGGAATSARLQSPWGLAVDTAGNLYIADWSNHAVRKVTAGGVISTIAGNGHGGFWGDYGTPAAASVLNYPSAVAVNSTGIYIADSFNSRVRLLRQVVGLGPTIGSGGVLNGASYTPSVAPGSIAAVFGAFNIGTPAGASGVPLPFTLAGLALQFDGYVNAPLFYAGSGQANIQVPWELAGQFQTSLQATANSQISGSVTVNLAPFAPGIFSVNGQGTGQGVILDSAYHVTGASNPATRGNIVQIFCTGLGAVSHQPATGAPAPTSPPLATTTANPTVTIGGVQAEVVFSGLAPGSVGEYQVNVKVAAGVVPGSALPVVISIGGVNSNTVTMAVK